MSNKQFFWFLFWLSAVVVIAYWQNAEQEKIREAQQRQPPKAIVELSTTQKFKLYIENKKNGKALLFEGKVSIFDTADKKITQKKKENLYFEANYKDIVLGRFNSSKYKL